MTFDVASGAVLLFGGSSAASANFADTWTWDASDWTQLHPGTNPSAAQPDFCGAMVNDPVSRQTVLVLCEHRAFVQTWVWDGRTWNQRQSKSAPPALGTVEIAYNAAAGRVTLFAGPFTIVAGLP